MVVGALVELGGAEVVDAATDVVLLLSVALTEPARSMAKPRASMETLERANILTEVVFLRCFGDADAKRWTEKHNENSKMQLNDGTGRNEREEGEKKRKQNGVLKASS